MKKIGNKGVTLVESLAAFMIICVAIVMLMGCIVSVVNTIATTREKNEDTQAKVNEFWKREEPTSKKKETIFIDGKPFYVMVNTYEIDDEKYYEYAVPTTVDNGNQ